MDRLSYCCLIRIIQCLQVLQKLTYNTRIFQSTNYIHELITFLVTNM